MSNDAGSLSNLNDIVLASPTSWWPLATGWYVIGVLLLMICIRLVYRYWHRYRSNQYRRAALAELAIIEAEQSIQALERVPALLKRTALHVWPRDQLAALSGQQWVSFLDQHCKAEPFKGRAGELLERLAYQPGELNITELQPLIDGVRLWIDTHRARSC